MVKKPRSLPRVSSARGHVYSPAKPSQHPGLQPAGVLSPMGSGLLSSLRACLVNNRVRLGGAKSASFLPTTASYEPFLRVDPSIFEAFLPKRAIGDRLSACAPERQEGSTLTFTKQALRRGLLAPHCSRWPVFEAAGWQALGLAGIPHLAPYARLL